MVIAPAAPNLPPSLWAATAHPGPAAPPLEGDSEADVAVVGGGFTGLSAALHLAEAGARVVLVEAAEPGWGASGRNGGQVIPGLKYDPDELERMYGPELGSRVVGIVGGTADLVFSLIEKHGIACEPVRQGWIQPAHTPAALATVRRRAEAWRRRGADVAVLDRAGTARLVGSGAYLGGWIDRRGGGLNPLSYARGLADAAIQLGARIHGRTPSTSLTRRNGRWQVATPGGRITADSVVLGTNAYTGRLWPGLNRTVMPVYSFQIATAPLGETVRRTILPDGQVASDTRRLLLYYRTDASGRLIMGGRGPFKDDPGPADAGQLRDAVRRLFPQIGDVRYEFHWAGRVAMTRDHLPHLHELAPGLHAGLGYNGRGVGMATMMGKLLAGRILGKGQDAIDFPISPMRPIPFHALHRPVVRAVTGWYRLRDALAARG